jgi:hypothetical protein
VFDLPLAARPLAPPAAGHAAAPAPAQPPWSQPAPATALDVDSLLAADGDDRILIDPATGQNRYGCAGVPDDVLAFGSSTASSISPVGYAAAQAMAARLLDADGKVVRPLTYARELDRLRQELVQVCGLADMAGLATIMAPSGTDVHRLVGQLVGCDAEVPPLAIVCEPAETGSGVGAAFGGLVGPSAALRGHASAFRPASDLASCQIMIALNRTREGAARPCQVIDEEVAAVAKVAARMGRRVLLVLMDVSKTGLISPSVDCALALKQQFPEQIEVFVDACQFRLSNATLRAYLDAGFLVGVTGSKFMGGPIFSGALFAPPGAAARLQDRRLPAGLNPTSTRADWPQAWPGAQTLAARENFGLLARWEGALAEMRRFNALPQNAVAGFFEDFAAVVRARLAEDCAFAPIDARPLNRSALGAASGWDGVQTIFSFALQVNGRPLSPLETLGVQRLMSVDLGGWAAGVLAGPKTEAAVAARVQLGQAVACGTQDGAPVSALRLCASARLAADALGPDGRGPQAVIDDALAALDKVSWLARRVTVEA